MTECKNFEDIEFGREPQQSRYAQVIGASPDLCLGIITELPNPLSPEDQRRKQHRLTRWQLQDVAARLRPESRMAICRRRRHFKSKGVELYRSPEGAVVYKGLMICGLIWECPLCAALVTQRRRSDLLAGINSAQNQGWLYLHLTLTVPHHTGDDLKALLHGLAKAIQVMMNRPSWKHLRREIGYCGYVRSLEVTYGAHGWHPHVHYLIFVDGKIGTLSKNALFQLGDRILPFWQSACRSAALAPPNRRGLEIEHGHSSRYAAKWGVEDEMTKTHLKKGRAGRHTPWDLLRRFMAAGDRESAQRWDEFATVFKGRHQLQYSRGLRAQLGLDQEKKDQELAEEQVTTAVRIGCIRDDCWWLVLKAGARGALLEIAREQGWPGVEIFLKALQKPLKAG